MQPSTPEAGPIIRDSNYQSPTYGSFIPNPAYKGSAIQPFDMKTGGTIGTQGSIGFGAFTPPPTTVIDSSKLDGNFQPLKVPPTPAPGPNPLAIGASIPTDLTNYMASIGSTGTESALPSTSQEEATVTDGQNNLKTWMMKLFEKPQAQKTAETQAGVPGLRQAVVDINNQIQSLQKQSAMQMIGQEDRLAPTSVITGAQNTIDRQRTIKMLGLSAVAQTLQGNLALAQDQANQAVEMEFAPYEQAIEYQKQLLEYNYKDLDRADQKRADALRMQLDERSRILQEQKEDKFIILGWSAEAGKNGAPTLILQRAQEAKTPGEALAILSPYFQDPFAKEQALAELEQTRTQTAQIYSNIQARKDEIANSGAPAAQVAAQSATLDNLQLVNDILSNPNDLYYAVGFGQYNPANLVPGFGPNLTKNRIEQLKSLLSLDARQKLKGSGAVSDFEAKTLERSTNALGANITPKQAEQELKRIRGVFQTASGGQATVVITDRKTGQKKIGLADRATIDSAIASGYDVQYQ